MKTRIGGALSLAGGCLILVACGGNYSGAPAAGNSSGSGNVASGSGYATPQAFFAAQVEPNIGFCRTCHVSGGVADTAGTSAATQGNLFLLTGDTTQDYNNVYAAWTALGGGVGTNKLLLNPSDPSQGHTGGQPWPSGSQPYTAMQTLLSCWNDPSGCAALLGGASGTPVAQQQPLLGGRHSGSLWNSYCANSGNPLPDSAVLPADPRTLVVSGVNQNKSVVFNTYWRSCDNPTPQPTTCGQYRQQVTQGALIGEGQGQAGTATMFSGSASSTVFSIPATDYNNLWKVWGLPGRPTQFDQLVAERHGSALAPNPNPYPLPGEDPNKTNGGSGQLPLVYTQLRNADGTWTGNIGVKFCAFCHNGQLGTAADGPGMGPQFGGAGSIGDFVVALRDFTAAGAPAFIATSGLLNIASNRGTGAIDQFQLGFVLFANGNPAALPLTDLIHSGAIGTIKSPPWWNLANRPQKFHGAILPTDASRIDMAAYYPVTESLLGASGATAAVAWVDQNDVPFQTWAQSLPSPAWPYGYCSNADGTPGPNDNPACINTPLAEQGAILFHSKNLWAADLNNPVPAPSGGGNGSCAGCHGAYSPRYVNDTTYLDSPALAGIAARTVPMNVIGTDPVYGEANQSLRNANGSIPPAALNNAFLYCGLGDQYSTAGNAPIMLAPPLYGIWAAAPYLHNGSVPNIWGVLDPGQERPVIWQRASAPVPSGVPASVVMGYDTDLRRAYDTTKLGWNYTVVNCGDPGTTPGVDCSLSNPNGPAPDGGLLGSLYKNFWFLWNLPIQTAPPFTNQQIENRKVYNTLLYSQGNQGHAFTSVLTDQERTAIIEYLKTL